ncbi:MAG: ferrochelatase [Rickettsiales bacterium]|nr:ferrochelatase [Rickettsiales bacterium]
MKKIAVVLLNLGGPDKLESVQPFLFNLFNDKAIISAPQPIRWMIAKLISTRRAPIAREIYEYLGGKSPLLELTQEQAVALDKALKTNKKAEYKSFLCMRYWHPMSAESVSQVKDWGPDEVILLPLYPQFSTTTTGSSFKDWEKQAKQQGLNVPVARVGCYPTQSDFIKSHAVLIKKTYEKAKSYGTPRILFSAHGLPQKIVDGGDPYQWQIQQTAAAIVEELEKTMKDGQQDEQEPLDTVVCYQSKVGPLEWLKPSTETEIERAAKDGVPVVILPIAFVSEHSETLVELDIEYRELAETHGIKGYERVPSLGTQPYYIKALKKLCLEAKLDHTGSHTGGRLCPPEFIHCACRDAA